MSRWFNAKTLFAGLFLLSQMGLGVAQNFGAGAPAATGAIGGPPGGGFGAAGLGLGPAPATGLPPVITNAPAASPATGISQGNVPGGAAPRPAAPGAVDANAASIALTVTNNEFQDFVSISTGRPLPLYGYNLFEGAPSTFAPIDNVPVTADYVIGPGDELLIRAWGQIDFDYRTTVDRNGSINIPRVGQISLAGVKYQELASYLRNAVGRVFRNFELSVTMGQLRSIQVLVVGQARRPGNYTVSSLSTLVNAIFAAGGPSPRGSMRAIQLKRGNRNVTEMDLYDLLVNGDKSKDAALLPGDVIYFPPIGPLAALSGSVNTPAIFELKANTSLEQLISWSGGLSTTAQTRRATIERIQDRQTRVVDQFAIDSAGLKRQVRDGDLISVFSISPKFENAVTLRGNVAAPLRYPYREGMRIRDLIPEKEALITPDYYLRRNLITRGEAPGGQQQLINQVRGLAAEINWEYAVVERLNERDLSTVLLPFNLGKAVLEGDATQNLLLRPGDVVTIFSTRDLAVPIARQTKLVRLEGEFTNPGVYRVEAGETLRQLVVRVGGIAQHAYLFGAEFTREATRVQQQKNLEESINRLERDMQRAVFSRAQSGLASDDAASIKLQSENQQVLITRLRQLRSSGRLVLELPADASLSNLPDLVLEDGDRFFVPPRPSMVNVFGTVYNENSFIYRTEKRVSDYLAQAGGPTKDADVSGLYLLRADGTVVNRRQTGNVLVGGSLEGFPVYPGDTIVVPEEFDKTTIMRSLKDFTQVLYQFGLGAAAIKVLR